MTSQLVWFVFAIEAASLQPKLPAHVAPLQMGVGSGLGTRLGVGQFANSARCASVLV